MNYRAYATGLLVGITLAVVPTIGCGAREFRNEQEAVAHFRAHRLQFERAAELFLFSSLLTLDVPGKPATGGESELARVSRELRVRHLARVPSVKAENERWVEFRLAQHLLPSTYGILYVPDGHERAFELIAFLVRSDVPPGN